MNSFIISGMYMGKTEELISYIEEKMSDGRKVIIGFLVTKGHPGPIRTLH